MSIGGKIKVRFAYRVARSATLVGRLLNKFSQGPVEMKDDEGEMNPALDVKVFNALVFYVDHTKKTGNVKIDKVDLRRILNDFTYERDGDDFKTGWWLNGAHKVIANGQASCVKRSGGRLSIKSIDVNLVWHDWIDANPSNENFIKNALETAFGKYDKYAYVSWEIRIPWKYHGGEE